MPERPTGGAWEPVAAKVSWRAERRGQERPAAVLWAGERFSVTAELDAWVEGGAVAGTALRRGFVVCDHLGQLWRIRVGEGDAEVELDAGSRQEPSALRR